MIKYVFDALKKKTAALKSPAVITESRAQTPGGWDTQLHIHCSNRKDQILICFILADAEPLEYFQICISSGSSLISSN